ncbi:MAG: RNA polymerase sigma factor (sigma-70 family) [Flavobacteriales bacterium]|jgi:RNA polymerase sigma-70 factor (ECF subfamily)
MKPSKKIKDSWLVTQYREGHTTAMAVLVKRWHIVFCRQAYRYCKDIAIAKDIAQDAWIKILNKMDALENPEKFGSWGVSIVTKKAIDWYRKNKINTEAKQRLDQTVDPEEEDSIRPLVVIAQLKTAITLLSEEHQKVLTLFYVESYGLIEISEILKISKGTVKSRLYYAREHLKTILK